MRLKVLSVVLLQKGLDLLGKEGEELRCGLGNHEFVRDLDLFLGNVEGGISVELDGTDAEVGSAEVAGEVETLVLLVYINGNAVRGSRPSQFHLGHLSRRLGSAT